MEKLFKMRGSLSIIEIFEKSRFRRKFIYTSVKNMETMRMGKKNSKLTQHAAVKKKNYINHPLLKKDLLVKRKYQIHIFLTCTQNNCLVVIPTGLGKTIVALLLAVHELKEEGSKVFFLAPTRPLVEQHYATFKDLTIFNEDELLMLTGSVSPDKRKELYDSDFRCAFSTPQVIQNDIIANRINLKTVNLFIFDEAHRASGNYSYNFIAKKYQQTHAEPRMLGLTASPGKNKEKILEVMQNLYLKDIEVRTEDDPDVKPYLHPVETVWKDVELPEEMNQCLEVFESLKKTYYTELKNNAYLESASVSGVTRRDLLKAGKQLDYDISRSQGTAEFPMLLYLKKVLANAMRVSHMHEVIETQGLRSLKTYLDKQIAKVEKGKGGKSLRELFNSVSMRNLVKDVRDLVDNQVNHPKIAVLMDLLQKQFDSNEESRVLVFCQFRDTIRTILDVLEKKESIHAKKFIGQQKKGKRKGMTQKQQLEVLNEFKDGTINTLVATSVAEEGLDIAECDVVIFYDVVPSEIRTIQRRGRTGRSKAGSVYILKTKGTREEGYFWAEKHREKQMKKVLDELKYEISKGSSKAESDSESQTQLTNFLKKGSKKTSTKKNSTINGEDLEKTKKDPQKTSQGENLEEKNIDKPKIQMSRSPQEEIRGKIAKDHKDGGSKNIDNDVKDAFKGRKSPFIIVDSRETSSGVVRTLSELNANIELKQIPIGDYIVSKRCGVERKSMDDFVDSIKDGRLFKEIKKLGNQFSRPILILEGDVNSIVSINRAAILGTITSIMLNMHIFLYQTVNERNTAEILIALAKKEQEDSNKTFSIRFKKSPENLKEKLEYIVAGIPDINVSRARDLLEGMGSIQAIFNASEQELRDVYNIGPKIAKKIRKYAKTEYKFS